MKRINPASDIVGKMTKTTNVTSIIRAIHIIQSLSKGNGKISQIANDVNLIKGTTHRLLATLVKTRFVVQDPLSLEYSLGPALLELAFHPNVTHKNLVTCALGQMKYLRDHTDETIVLHVRSGLERVCIACVESSNPIRYINEVGFISPLYLGGAGKILLAGLEDPELSLILDNIDLIPMTPNTITDRVKLTEEICKVRERGYATSSGERIAGSSSVSVAVKNYITPVALSVYGPDSRLKIDEMSDLLDQLQTSAKKISKKLRTQAKDHQTADS
jgi:DNA-binding IclR family transcriptional regulator